MVLLRGVQARRREGEGLDRQGHQGGRQKMESKRMEEEMERRGEPEKILEGMEGVRCAVLRWITKDERQ